jgi:DNA-binding NarL/FixJ family response regulator
MWLGRKRNCEEKKGMAKGSTEGTVRVLIADDSSAMRDRLSQMVTQVAAVGAVHLAQDVSGTLALVRDEALDLVILDVQMPGGSGLEVLRAAKEKSPATIVIILTNFPYPQYKQRCMELGADYFISKSTDSNELSRLIDRLAVSRSAAKQFD